MDHRFTVRNRTEYRRVSSAATDRAGGQNDLAEIVGMTSIHVNRVLRKLRQDAVVVFRGGRVDILDRDRLHSIGQFEPSYLYLADDRGPADHSGPDQASDFA